MSLCSSIVREGHTFHGTGVCGRGVFKLTDFGITYVYAGQIRDGYACGLGVVTRSCGKAFAEYGPDGKLDGRFVYVSSEADGLTGYILFERGVPKERACIHRLINRPVEFEYNGEFCAAEDPRVHALIARVAPVEALAAAEAYQAEEAVASLPRRLAGLELMVTVLLARDRRPLRPLGPNEGRPLRPLGSTEGRQNVTGVAAALLALPSGLLEIVGEAITR
jgi:hypothetical protein